MDNLDSYSKQTGKIPTVSSCLETSMFEMVSQALTYVIGVNQRQANLTTLAPPILPKNQNESYIVNQLTKYSSLA